MKKLFLLLPILFISCHNWDKLPNGKEYYVEQICIESHDEIMTTYIYIDKVPYPQFTNIIVCDKYINGDTIFRKQNK